MAEHSPDDLRRLDVLGRIIAAAGERSTNPQALPQDLLGSESDHASARDLRERVRELEGAGYVTVDWRFSGGWSARPTAQGKDAWSALETARGNVRARRQRMRDEYLVWVVDQDDAGGSPTSDDFLRSGANYLGMPYTQEDLEQTGKWLHEGRFIKGPMADQRPDPLRPEPMAKGRWIVEQGKSVNEPTHDESPGSATYTNHFHAPANVAQNSQHVQQTINIGWQDQARELVDEISGRLQHVEDEQARAELATTVEELRAEVDGQARPGAVRGIVTKLGLAIGTAMAGELGSELTQHAFQLLLQLPA
ncbi:transcriptional regulator (plasmid) [Curtobacterium sp. C1]|uniref:transcriptional regulator n=1 Tax=Curtobacterium sp. C1 TaxID=2898151 RepID=UPI001E462220|nr:transcriptional regulator [Curtobacterium sp. C1]UFU15989.1 transcriptional regulator [Curtobacterium sp. C1]